MPVRYTVSLHNYEGWDGNEIEKRSNLLLSEVLSEINTIYAEMSNTHYEEALIKITILQNKYPRLTYLKFIQASCLLLLGKNQQAKIALDEALMEFPNQTEGLKLYKLLNAKAFRTPANTKTDQKQDSNLKQDTDVQNE